MEPDIVRKDAPAADTIERIHGILDSIGFPRERALVRHWTAGDDCHSCHVRFANYPLIFANGKGLTRELAYAGALAEFLERLQCRADALFTRAGNIHRLPLFGPRRDRTRGELASVAPALVATDLSSLAAGEPDVLPCLEFVDVLGERLVDLPFDAFCMMTGSSGMCAGNTPEEALAHGICEVFERHVIHLLESRRVQGLPTVPFDRLPLRSGLVRRQLDSVMSAGIEVLVKDATIGGVVPVVGLVLADRAAGTCHVSFGSDPVFDLALSRCVTEAFQGTDRLFRPRPQAGGSSGPLDTYNNLEVLLDRLTESVGASRVESAFGDATTCRAAMQFAVDRVRQLGLGLYVRDFSWFGFPAYYVYVESLSALRTLGRADFSHLYTHLDAVRTTLFRLPHASTQEIARCGEVLFDEVTRANPTLEKELVSNVLQAPVAGCLGLRPLLVLMLLEAGAVDKARTVLEWPPASAPILEQPVSPQGVATWLPSYAKTRRGAVAAATLAARFAEAFGFSDIVREADVNAATGPVPLPRCQSVYACPSCPCRPFCRLDEWYRLAVHLRARAATIRQDALLERLRSSASHSA
jgi:YcaO-like protein with predicted kinase domain